MGYMRHHGMLVTGVKLTGVGEADRLQLAHARAKELLPLGTVSEISPAVLNHHQSFAVFPDGSKEGWKESDLADKARAQLIAYLVEIGGEGYLDWVLVQFGDDDKQTCILLHSDGGGGDRP